MLSQHRLEVVDAVGLFEFLAVEEWLVSRSFSGQTRFQCRSLFFVRKLCQVNPIVDQLLVLKSLCFSVIHWGYFACHPQSFIHELKFRHVNLVGLCCCHGVMIKKFIRSVHLGLQCFDRLLKIPSTPLSLKRLEVRLVVLDVPDPVVQLNLGSATTLWCQTCPLSSVRTGTR